MKAIVTAALIAAIAIGASACGPAPARTAAAQPPLPALSTNPVSTYTAPAPVPSPDGTYSGSCDYTLSDSFSMSDAGTLIGEIDLENTGNVGTIDHVRITWPQEGFAPIVATRTVRAPAGASKTVRFHVTASQNVISELQSWQEHHNLRDGCHYRATITGTYGGAR